MFLKAGVACCLVAAAALGASERARVDRASALSAERLTQWLGPALPGSRVEPMRFTTTIWPAPMSMDVESQAAFQLARARFAAIAESDATRPFLDGVAWHLQARLIEELFDLEHQRPGHHAVALPLFGSHVTWTIPALVVSRQARDDWAAPRLTHAAAAVRTLENVVGWPALASALRVLASRPGPLDRAGIEASLSASLGIPVAWFMDALEPGFHLNHRLVAVTTEPATCGGGPCTRTTIDVAREGAVLFPDAPRAGALQIAVQIDFDGLPGSTIWWNGRDNARLTVESAQAPLAVRLDPDRVVALDADPHDQQWSASPRRAAAPVTALAAWLVWLQHSLLIYTTLL